jgi:hypothetical protein
MHWVDSLGEKSVRVWYVLYHSLSGWFWELGLLVLTAITWNSKNHDTKSKMSILQCARTGFMTLADFRGNVPSFRVQVAGYCIEITMISDSAFLQHDPGGSHNRFAQTENEFVSLRTNESDIFARPLLMLDTVKCRISKLISEFSELASNHERIRYEISFKPVGTDDEIHFRFGELNSTTYRLKKYTGSCAELHIAMYARHMLLNCRGYRSFVQSLN